MESKSFSETSIAVEEKEEAMVKESEVDLGGVEPAVGSQHRSAQTVLVNMHPDAEKSNDDPNSTTLGEVFHYYVDRFSMHGLSLLVGSDNRIVKVIWAIIILLAIAEVSLHIYSLVAKFLEYSTRTEILLGFSSLHFPAVTVCNANVMRRSKTPVVEIILADIIAAQNAADQKVVENNTDIKINKERPDKLVLNALKKNSTPPNFFDLENKFYGKNLESPLRQLQELSEDSPIPVALDPGSWEAVAKKSELFLLAEFFRRVYSSMSILEQKTVGHQAKQLIQLCSFATRKCISNYTQRTYADYGNCYTIEDTRFISKQSGPLGGLELIFFLETDEYVPFMTPGKAVQIIIHAPNTVPLPSDEGISIPAGQQAMIGLKETKITRLGEPYSPCIEAEEYKKLYNVTYTRNLCKKICFLKQVADQCKCQDTQYYHINEIMKLNIKNCIGDGDDLECVIRVKNTFKADDPACKCLNPCSEIVFDLQTGYRLWPDKETLDMAVNSLCREEPDKCNSFRQKNEAQIRENFIKLDIFYRDLNYEQLVEQKNYEINQLLSDFGGSLGLAIGFSFISLLEMTHMVIGIVRFLLCKVRP